MASIAQAAAENLLSPMVLFFALGLLAGWAKSDLAIPEAIAKALSIYLMMSIGMKGGIALAENGIDQRFLLLCLAGILLSFLLPFLAYVLFRRLGGIEPISAAAIAAHYGSISIVTYVAATAYLRDAGIAFSDQMVAIAALMETPAIMAGLFLAHRLAAPSAGSTAASANRPPIGRMAHEVFLNGSVTLLIGAFVIGWLTGGKGGDSVAAFMFDPFKGVLCLFLLDMGLLAARRLAQSGLPRPGTVVAGILVPLCGAVIALLVAAMLGVPAGNGMLFTVLGASASYIAVPAAMRLALPRADGGLAITLSLAVTFPFNIVLGLPLYAALAGAMLQP